MVVSAGPSLGKNLELLKEIRDRVVVIAVQTTLKPLLNCGITPDFVTSLDYHEVGTRFYEGLDEELRDVHLVAEPKANWRVVDYYRDRGPMSLLGNEVAKLVLGEENDDRTAFADGWPCLVTAEESVDDLTQRVRWAVEPRRFRPNIHLRGLDEAYREDAIKRLRFASNDAVLAMLKPCARCPVPNVDPGTGRVERGKKPTIALKAYRKLVSGEVLFGQNAVLEGVDSVIVKVGDVLEIDEMKGPEEMPTFV